MDGRNNILPVQLDANNRREKTDHGGIDQTQQHVVASSSLLIRTRGLGQPLHAI